MTTGEIQKRVYSRLNDDPNAPASVTPKEVLDAIAEGQELAAFLTLCFPVTVNLTITAGTPSYNLRATFPDLLVPLALRVNGARVTPSTPRDMMAADDRWESSGGTPKRYTLLGFNFLLVTPQPVADTPAQLTYAAAPSPLAIDQEPDLDAEYLPALERFALWRVTLKEGAGNLERGKGYLAEYMEAIGALADAMRPQALAAHYDAAPFELQRYLSQRAKLK